MADITVTVTGPGGTISGEAVIIKRALEAAGIKVTLTDEHPHQWSDDELVAHVGGMKRKATVEIVLDHQPWGG